MGVASFHWCMSSWSLKLSKKSWSLCRTLKLRLTLKIIRATKTDLVLSEQKKRPPKGGHVVGHTHAHRGCTVFRIICLFVSLNLLILLILRPNTLSCTQSYHDIEIGICPF